MPLLTKASPQSSAAWYLGMLVIGIMVSRFSGYFWFERPVVFGQPSNVVLQWIFFGLAMILWFILDSRNRAEGLFLTFLLMTSVAWLIHLGLYRLHGDAFNYTALLYVPIVLMVLFKPPNFREGLEAIAAYAWTACLVVFVTLALELLGGVNPKPQSAEVIAFDEARYWLPFNDLLGIDGRWTGPFSHNGDTAMMGALLVVIAFVKWRKSSWVFLGTGLLVLLLTFGRASIGAALVGLLVVFMLTNSGFLGSVPRFFRIGVGGFVAVAAAVFLATRPAGVTGRDNFWTAFIDLWLTSPLVGVGSSGIAVSGGVTQQWGHAHNMYIDELARYGLVGLIAQMSAIAIGVLILALAANRGFPGPLAVAVTYLVTAITEPRNNWIHPSVVTMLLLLLVALAAASLRRDWHESGTDGNGNRDGRSLSH